MEIVIDYCKIPSDFVEQFYALNVYDLAREYDRYSVDVFNKQFVEFVDTNEIVKRMFNHFVTIDNKNTYLLHEINEIKQTVESNQIVEESEDEINEIIQHSDEEINDDEIKEKKEYQESNENIPNQTE